MTLRWRLTLFYTSLLAVLLLVIDVAVVGVLSNNLRGGIATQLREDFKRVEALALANTLSRTNILELGFANINQYYDFDTIIGYPPGRLDQLTLDEFIALRSDSGDDTPTSQNLLPNPAQSVQPFQFTREQFDRLKQTKEYFTTSTVTTSTGKHIPVMVLAGIIPYVRVNNVDNSSIPSSQIVYLARDLTQVQNTLKQLQGIMLLVSLFGLALTGVGAYFLAGRALMPLRQVRKAAESISEKTLGRRVPEPETGDEVQALAGALNNMLDRLERSFDAQRRFTSDASHELRTPVTAISGHAGYLLRRTSPNPQQAESLTIIKNEADRLSNLIASLLELARSDSGVMQLRRAPVLARFFLEDITRELLPVAAQHGAHLQVSGDDVEFSADPDKLRQVILNLVSNSLKAGSRTVTLDSERDGQDVLLHVRDDGPGIPEEHLGRLFDRFYRVEESRSRDQGGSGLGLAIVKAIVDAHEGVIWVESEIGRGTTVHVRLPIGQVEPDGAEEEDIA